MTLFLGHFQLIFELIFGSFSSVWQRNKQNGTKHGKENVKNSYCEIPGKGNLEKWHFSHQAHCQKDEN